MFSNMPPYNMALLPGNDQSSQLEDFSRQIALSNVKRQGSNRHSRGSSNVRSGAVAKINSAGNSPRLLRRRRTTAADNRHRHRLSQTTHFDQIHDPTGSRARPTTWHIPSQMPGNAMVSSSELQSSQGFRSSHDGYLDAQVNMMFNDPSTPSLYPNSEAISPAIPSSPSNALLWELNGQQMMGLEALGPNYDSGAGVADFFNLNGSQSKFDEAPVQIQRPAIVGYEDGMTQQQLWPSFSPLPLFTSATSPEFDGFLPLQRPESPEQTSGSLDADERAHADETLDPKVKELVGMGLYDKPDTSPVVDQPLDRYRRQLMNGLLGKDLGLQEPVGKGLKLEETWVPPEAEPEVDLDEDESPVDDTDDARGDEIDPTTGSQQLSNQSFLFDDDELAEVPDFTNGVPMPAAQVQAGQLNEFAWI
ncbi:MAG: hypothetical protein M1825_006509 [Sarcosagium campestre]|nr:MAG: hypothetical protein M1825_006509 [Sarcosagium campestre]